MSKSPNTTGHNNSTFGLSRIRVIRGGGLIVQQRRDDKEQFTEMMIQLRVLETRADAEMAEYYRRNLIQQVERMVGKTLCTEKELVL
jgi:hypothetical protein